MAWNRCLIYNTISLHFKFYRFVFLLYAIFFYYFSILFYFYSIFLRIYYPENIKNIPVFFVQNTGGIIIQLNKLFIPE